MLILALSQTRLVSGKPLQGSCQEMSQKMTTQAQQPFRKYIGNRKITTNYKRMLKKHIQ